MLVGRDGKSGSFAHGPLTRVLTKNYGLEESAALRWMRLKVDCSAEQLNGCMQFQYVLYCTVCTVRCGTRARRTSDRGVLEHALPGWVVVETKSLGVVQDERRTLQMSLRLVLEGCKSQ